LPRYRTLAASLPGERFRYDPNSALSLADAIEFGRNILTSATTISRTRWGMRS
jgi:hypothetical protein